MKALLRCGSAPSSGSSRSGASASGAPLRPAPDELGGQQLLVGRAGGPLAQVLPEGRHPRVQLAEDHVGAVAAQHLGLRHRRQVAGLVHVAQDELAGLERRLVRVVAGNAAAFNRRLAHAILEAEWLALVRQRVDVLSPDRHDAGEIAQAVAGALKDRLKLRGIGRERDQRDMDIGRAERRFPVFGRVLADIAQLGCPRRHALLELQREAGERTLRHAQRLEALEAERRSERGLLAGIGRAGGGIEHRDQPPQQFAAGVLVVDAQQDIGAGVGRGPGVQGPGLDIMQLERDAGISGRAVRSGLGGHSGHSALFTFRHRCRRWIGRRRHCRRVGRRQIREGLGGRGVAWLTPSRMRGPLPALISSVARVSITSSLSERPPQVACVLALEQRLLDLKEAVLGIRLGDIHHQVIGQQQLGQRVVALRVRRPIRLAIKAVKDRAGWR